MYFTRKIAICFILSVLFFFGATSTVVAHPGRTASDGCHYCRTNCSSWGVSYNQRHCHGGVAPALPLPTNTYDTDEGSDSSVTGWVVFISAVIGGGYYLANRKK